MGINSFGYDFGFDIGRMSNEALRLLWDLGFSEKEINKGELQLASLSEKLRPIAKELLDYCKLPNSAIGNISTSIFNNYARFIVGIDGDPESLSAQDLEYYLKLKDHGFAIVDTCLKSAYMCYRNIYGEKECQVRADNPCLEKPMMSAETLKQIGIGEMKLPNGAAAFYIANAKLYGSFSESYERSVDKWKSSELGLQVALLKYILSRDLSKDVAEFTSKNEFVAGVMALPMGKLAESLSSDQFSSWNISRVIKGSNQPSADLDKRLKYYAHGNVDLRAFSDEELSGVDSLVQLSKRTGMELGKVVDIAERVGYNDPKKIEAEVLQVTKQEAAAAEQSAKDLAKREEEWKKEEVKQKKANRELRIKTMGGDRIAAEERIAKFFTDKNMRSPLRVYMSLIDKIGYKQVELIIHKFIDPKYPAPKGFKEFDDTRLNEDLRKELVESFRPNYERIPGAVKKAAKSIKWLDAIRQYDGEMGHGSMVCVGVEKGYAVFLTATHVINRKIKPEGHIQRIIAPDIALIAIPIPKGVEPPTPLEFGGKLKKNETFYSVGFAGEGDNPLNICTDASYTDHEKGWPVIAYKSLGYMGDSGGAVLNAAGKLVGIMQMVGGEETVSSRLTTYAYGDMEVVKEALQEFISGL